MSENLNPFWNITLCLFKEEKRVDGHNFWREYCSYRNFQPILFTLLFWLVITVYII